MLTKTTAILLQSIKHGEKAIILKLFTREKGLITAYIKNTTSKTRRAVKWQILDHVEVEILFKESTEICNIKESAYVVGSNTRYFDPVKSSLSFFTAEILIKVIAEKHFPNEELFEQTVKWIDAIEESKDPSILPFVFLVELSELLGIKPQVNGSPEIFNLSEGTITDYAYGLQSISIPETKHLAEYLTNKKFETKPTKIERLKLVQLMLDFLKYHIHSFMEIKSLPVLKELLN